MKLLLIAGNLAKKRKWSLLFLMIEIILSSIVLLSLIGELLFLENSSQIAKTFEGTDSYYFTKRIYYTPDFRIEDYLDEKIKAGVHIGNIHTVRFDTEEQKYISGLAYSDVILDKINIEMLEGEWITDSECEGIPLVAVGGNYCVGEEITISEGNKGTIVGIIEEDSYCVTFMASGSSGYASLSNFISTVSGIDFIMPYTDSKYWKTEDVLFESDMAQESQIICVQDASVREELINTLKQYGDISSIEEMEQKYLNDIREFYIVNGIVLAIFSVLTIVGISGMNGIQSIENERQYTILYIIGLDKRKCMLIEAMNTFTVIGVSYVVVLFLYKTMASWILPSGVQSIDSWILGVLFLYLIIIYFITSISFIRKAGKQNIMELYKRGHEL